MTLRTHFERKVQELRDEILHMRWLVEEELRLALAAFAALDAEQGKAVTVADREVNKARFAIEEKCFSLIVTQQPIAYAHTNTGLARIIARQDDEVDTLYAQVFNRIMMQMAVAGSSEKAESAYELLRVARELERFGDLVTNVGERIIYQETGTLEEINVDERKE